MSYMPVNLSKTHKLMLFTPWHNLNCEMVTSDTLPGAVQWLHQQSGGTVRAL